MTYLGFIQALRRARVTAAMLVKVLIKGHKGTDKRSNFFLLTEHAVRAGARTVDLGWPSVCLEKGGPKV